MIINGELQTGLGGGVCQVSTTVFNAAYEAGLQIDERTNHALYISHYPLGRDATVNYPDLDLQVHERHRQVAAAAHVRRLGLADRQPLRHAAEPARRDDEQPLSVVAAPPVKRSRTRRSRRARAWWSSTASPPRSTERQPGRLRRERHGAARGQWYSSYRSRAEGRSASARSRSPSPSRRRPEPKDEPDEIVPSEVDALPDAPPAGSYPSALATASANHAGTRVGRRVVAVDGRVRRRAVGTSSSSRSNAYS